MRRAPGSALAKALKANGISVVDATISGLLFLWECHRTHTVKPPPSSYSYNPYCKTDEDPKIDSKRVVLQRVSELLARDAKLPYVVGHWVLDDWAWWDPGSARALLREVHALLAKDAPGLPAICGFGAGVARPGKVDWDPGDGSELFQRRMRRRRMVQLLAVRTAPSVKRKAARLDDESAATCDAATASKRTAGRSRARRSTESAKPGAVPTRSDTISPGLTRGEMLDQAKAFCRVRSDVHRVVRVGRQRLRIADADAEQFAGDRGRNRGRHRGLSTRLELIPPIGEMQAVRA